MKKFGWSYPSANSHQFVRSGPRLPTDSSVHSVQPEVRSFSSGPGLGSSVMQQRSSVLHVNYKEDIAVRGTKVVCEDFLR